MEAELVNSIFKRDIITEKLAFQEWRVREVCGYWIMNLTAGNSGQYGTEGHCVTCDGMTSKRNWVPQLGFGIRVHLQDYVWLLLGQLNKSCSASRMQFEPGK